MNTRLQRVERVLLLIGLLAVVVYGANLLYSRFYQAYAHWSFDQSLKAQAASPEGFLAHLARVETTKHPGPSGLMVEPARDSLPAPVLTEEAPNTQEWAAGRVRAHQQSLSSGAPPPIGRLQIPAIDLSVIVLEGTDGWTLNRAVGHIEGTALPWEPGNSGLAGHRDGFFRGLEKISKNDRIVLTTLKGTYHYRVDGIEIVNPADIGVLDASPHPTLTLVTCYPFHFVGSAPKRFIVRAALLQEQKATGVMPPQLLPGGVISL